MDSSTIVLHDVLPLSSVAVLLMPALIVALSAIAVTLSVLLARLLTVSSAAVWGRVQALRWSGRRFGVPCR